MSDLETSVDQTEETISVLEEENMQLQLTVNQLLERVQVLEAMVTTMGTIVNSTSNGLQGIHKATTKLLPLNANRFPYLWPMKLPCSQFQTCIDKTYSLGNIQEVSFITIK